jgi:hypothetical protein
MLLWDGYLSLIARVDKFKSGVAWGREAMFVGACKIALGILLLACSVYVAWASFFRAGS